jgi:predicted short-subunit dehydrogenase-like oxidoreductase (DUF2520 family)
VVEAIAHDLLRSAGLSGADAWAALVPLVRGTLDNLARHSPLEVLTGPVVRGDAATVSRHLDGLAGIELELYRRLGVAALDLARRRGLDGGAADRVARALVSDPPPGRPPEG